MPGIKVGDGAIVASESLVTSEVEPCAIVGGNPARLIRKRFDDVTIAHLLEIAWWDWPVEEISRYVREICGADVEALISAKYKIAKPSE